VNATHASNEVQSIIHLAKEFARLHGQNYVGTEHLLLALLGESDCLGARVLAEFSVDEDRAKEKIDELITHRLQETWVLGRLPGTPHFRDVLARAAEAARGQGNWQVRSEHLLIALFTEKQSVGCKTLQALGVTIDAVRKSIARHVSPH
jgi:ATP-dependent Clp protease ATP-binding subunit ClpC